MVKKGYLRSDETKFFEEKCYKKNAKNKNKKSNPIKKKHNMNIINSLNSNKLNRNKNLLDSNINRQKSNSKNKIKGNKSLNLDNHKNNKSHNNEEENNNNFGIIKINLKKNIKDYYPSGSNQSLHNYTFQEAIKYDRRDIFRVAYIYLLSKQILFRTFLQRCPLELLSLRFINFIFMFSCDLALNALFYFNDNISKKYQYARNLFLFTFSNNITIIIYSTLLSYALITLLNKLSNSSYSIRNIFRKEEQKMKSNKKYKYNDVIKNKIYKEIEDILKNFRIKVAFMLLIETILILFFWYFVTAFCHVYSSTQTSWLLDSFLSILSRLIIELIFAFIFGKLYQISVASNFHSIYKAVICIYDF